MNRTVVAIVLVVLSLDLLFLASCPTLPPPKTTILRNLRTRITGAYLRRRYRKRCYEPDEISVEEGDFVERRLTSERPVEAHARGYDQEGDVLPGEEPDLSFEADINGRFEIEDHEPQAQLGTPLGRPR